MPIRPAAAASSTSTPPATGFRRSRIWPRSSKPPSEPVSHRKGDCAYPIAHRLTDHARRSCRGGCPVAGSVPPLVRRAHGHELSCLCALTRLNEAIQIAMAGRSWTEAAHAAGFADSAHLNAPSGACSASTRRHPCRANRSSTPCVQARCWDRGRHSHRRSVRGRTPLA